MVSDMAAARDRGELLAPLWGDFAAYVRETKPPHDLKRLLDTLTKVRGDRAASDIAILDHGCGDGVSLLYLLGLGYTGIHGIEVGKPNERWNPLLREVFGIEAPRFLVHDGRTLPFGDDHFDLIFSQQVVEHVKDELIESYYAEEGRALKPGGLVYHQVPHRLYLYDSHTRTWFIHWLPRPIRRILYTVTGNDPDFAEDWLHFRLPSFHRRMVHKYIGPFIDHSFERFVGLDDLSSFRGPRRLRRVAGRLVTAPAIGPVAWFLLRKLIQIDTVAVKR